MPQISILNYGAGNVQSLINSVESLDWEAKVMKSAEELKTAERVIFPG